MKNEELTRSEVLKRLREVWLALELSQGELSAGLMEIIEANFRLADIFIGLQGAKDFTKVNAIGFSVDEGDAEEEDEE